MASSGNFCTLNTLDCNNSADLTNGSLTLAHTNSAWRTAFGNMGVSSGKWYFESRQVNSASGNGYAIAIQRISEGLNSKVWTNYIGNSYSTYGYSYAFYTKGSGDASEKVHNNSFVTTSDITAGVAGDVYQIALDLDNNKVWFGKNNTWHNSGDPANNSNETYSSLPAGTYCSAVCVYTTSSDYFTHNYGQDSTFGGVATAGGNADGNGFGDFAYAPPTGFLAICTGNLPVSDNIDPAQTDDNFPGKQFNAITWTGNRTSNSTVNNITGVGFQPDLVWLKILNNTYDHRLVDSSRGVTEAIRSNQTTAEQTEANGLYQFGSDGFSVKGDNNYNSNGDPFIGYCWRANGGTTASNSDGDITSTVQANTNAGFSIVTYTGDNTDHRGVGYGSANIGHGLDSAPEFIITKRRNASASWYVLHASAGVGYLTLNSSIAFQSGAVPFGPALPTTTTFGAYSANNNSGATYINYCWHSVEGYSKFGSFEGNADNNGPFIYTGFRPRLLFIKNMDSSSAWGVYDGERPGFNDSDLGAWDETTGYNNNIGTYPCDILSNGFKLKTSNSTVNSSHTWVYGAWGDVPFKYNNTF